MMVGCGKTLPLSEAKETKTLALLDFFFTGLCQDVVNGNVTSKPAK